MRIVLATVHSPFIYGGSEVLCEDLRQALSARGHEVETVAVPWRWSPSEDLIDEMLSFRLLDLASAPGGDVDLLLALKFPAYLTPHPRKVLWLFHQHQPAYNLWADTHGMSNDPRGVQVRDAIRQADRKAFAEARKIFTISDTVSARLRQDLALDSEPLYPPPRNAGRFYRDTPEGFLFFPSRIAPLKRQDLVLAALARTCQPVRVCFAGRPDTDAYGTEIHRRAAELGVEKRVDWAGWLSEDEILERYARCLGVVFTPHDEDFGFVTAEAMLAAKPVITCRDSGGPVDLVLDGDTGWVTEPDPEALAAAMDELWASGDRGSARGKAGRERYDALRIHWDTIVERLLE